VGLRGAHTIPEGSNRDVVLPHEDAISIEIACGMNRDDTQLAFEDGVPHGWTIRAGILESMAVDPTMNPVLVA
jgi:hypothetical protein